MIEESLLDDEDEQLEKIDQDLKKSLKIVTKAEKMSTPEWVGELLGGNYTGSWTNYYVNASYKSDIFEIGHKGWVKIDKDMARIIINDLSKFKCFNGIKYRPQRGIIEFKYNRNKDFDRDVEIEKQTKAELDRIAKYQEDVKNADTSRWTPDAKNILKMKGYMAKNSNPERIAKSCGDDKLVQRWLISMGLGWDKAVRSLYWEIKSRGLLSSAEIEAYQNKYKDFKIE